MLRQVIQRGIRLILSPLGGARMSYVATLERTLRALPFGIVTGCLLPGPGRLLREQPLTMGIDGMAVGAGETNEGEVGTVGQ